MSITEESSEAHSEPHKVGDGHGHDDLKTRSLHSDAVYSYELPIRIWHWVQLFAMIALCVTGYLIGSPPPSLGGEAYDHFLFGWIRYIHFVAAYIFIIGIVGRIYWAFVGNSISRQIIFPKVWQWSFWVGLFEELKWYGLIVHDTEKHEGHNPLGALSIHLLFLWPSIFMIFTGLALYGEGTGMDSWQFEYFSSWVIPLFGQSQDVHTWHHMIMWLLICFIIIHVYLAVREDIMSPQTIIGSMISGWRYFRDPRPEKPKKLPKKKQKKE